MFNNEINAKYSIIRSYFDTGSDPEKVHATAPEYHCSHKSSLEY